MKKENTIIISPKKYNIFQKWYTTAIRCLLDYYNFDGDYNKLARELNPPISKTQAKQSISILLESKMIAKNKQGYLRPVPHNGQWETKPEPKSKIIRQYQIEVLDLGQKARKKFSSNNLKVNTLTLSCSKKGLEKIKDEMKRHVEKIQAINEQDQHTHSVYHYNMTLFPMVRNVISL